MPIDPTTDAYVLEGRVVTMGQRGVIAKGRIYLRGRGIEFVRSAGEAVPQGFETAPRVDTGGTIYPGLIEIHNHLAYNAMPLWDVPLRYTNNGQWRSPANEDYRRKITKPSQVLGQSPGVLQALVRYVECRAMFGGVTSTQGITLANASGLAKHFKGLVRNVEHRIGTDLAGAGTNIANPQAGHAQEYLDRLNSQAGAYLQHLSEGKDKTARQWFLNLKIDEQDWAITNRLCGIHCAALGRDDLDRLHGNGGSMVWSPTSNYLLYGDTADLRAAKASKIRMALGSDWAPSGSKNLLGELKVAWLASQNTADDAGKPLFSPEELVRMATINPAMILGWQERLGSIERNKWADLVVVKGKTKNAYRHLIEAPETAITLVLIDGVPRVGTAALMAKFGDGTETTTIGGSPRILNLNDPTSDPLVAAETLKHATHTLADGMARLPELAKAVDDAMASVGFAGATDAAGQSWRVMPDFETEEQLLAVAMGIDLAAEKYADWVTDGMTLDPITVADDPDHLVALVRAKNLPDFVKKGLPALYGQTVALPIGADFLMRAPEPVAPQVMTTTRELREFARTSGELSLEDRRTIVDEALLVLQENYVHLPLKRAMHAVDPVQRLRLLRRRLEEQPADQPMPPEAEFHTEVTEIFTSLRDLHTGYRLPVPFAGRVAWLPFLVEACVDQGRRRYLVTKVVAEAGPDNFVDGVEITHWNGMTMDQAVARNGERQAGSNLDARHARGLNSLTLRPLARSLPPDEEWVTIRYVPLAGNDGAAPAPTDFTQPWLVFEPGDAGRFNPADLLEASTALGVDDHTDDIQHTRKILFAPVVAQAEAVEADQRMAVPLSVAADVLETHMPGVFKARIVQRTGAGSQDPSYGYVRIYTFNVGEAEAFIDEFVDLVGRLPVDGLILDVRGNGGGLIHAAEGLLQVLSPRRIEPEGAQFITTPLNLRICRRHANSAEVPGLNLGPWIPSLSASVATGATYSHGFTITSETLANQVGQRYFGPTVLITDPLCYSATDMFAAGFQDHAIGPVIGVNGATGAGGANVWSHALLQRLLEATDATTTPSPYHPLPRASDLRVAIRRTTRVADNPGDVLEDLGVTPDIRYEMTKRDLLHGNLDLIDQAIAELEKHEPHPMTITLEPRAGRPPLIVVEVANMSRLDTRIDIDRAGTIDRRWFASRQVNRKRVKFNPHDILDPDTEGAITVEVSGYEADALVARRRETLQLG